MKRWLALFAGGFGLAAFLRRRHRSIPVEIAPADELRRRLAESRVGEPLERVEPEVEPESVPVVEPEGAADRLDERRRDVHDRARAAIDELR